MSDAYTHYDERYVAFLDVLGFADIVSHLDPDDEERLVKIYFALNTAKLVKKANVEADSLTTTSFSDNVVASAPLSADGLFQLVLFCHTFAWTMLNHGYLCRGAVVKGCLWHDDHVVFGKGLVDAYRMETKVADVARIVISGQVVKEAEDHAKAHTELRDLSKHIVQAHDGPFYLNFLMPISYRVHRWQAAKPADYETYVSPEEDAVYRQSVRKTIRTIIEKHLSEATDDPHVFAKVRWLAEQFNQWATEGEWSHDRIKIYG